MVPAIGVDEAGRGPVLGSLFVAAVAVDEPSSLPEGVADSKTLDPSTRARLATELAAADGIETAVVELDASTIDRRERSLTQLIAEAFAEAIDRLWRPGWAIYADAGEADTNRFAGRLRRFLPTEADPSVRIGGDATILVVSAASIVAKEHRERHVAELRNTHGDLGSGYPSDPRTRRYLATYVEEHRELPPFARASWRTCDDAIAAVEQASMDRFVSTGDD